MDTSPDNTTTDANINDLRDQDAETFAQPCAELADATNPAENAAEPDIVCTMNPPTMKSTLGARIAWACETDPQRRSHAALARDCELNDSTLQRMRGNSYRFPRHWDTVYKLADVLEVSREWLRYGAGQPRAGVQAAPQDEASRKNTLGNDSPMNNLNAALPKAVINHEEFAAIYEAVLLGFKDAGLPIDANMRAISGHAWVVAHELAPVVSNLGIAMAVQMARSSTARLILMPR